MTFSVNHPMLYLLALIPVVGILAQSVYFLGKALRRSRQIGMDPAKLRKTIRTAAVFTIAPAVSIVISVITLSKTLGIPLPWLRLSVVGSLSYEAIAVSSIVTTVIILLGVVCIVPLTPILEAPVLEPAFAQMLPALFGGLGVAFVSKNWKIAVAPILLMLILFIFVPALNAGTVGIMVPVSVLFTIAVSRLLYKRGVL